MPFRKCPYCKGLASVDLSDLQPGGYLVGRAALDICQNCGTPVYFVTPHQDATAIPDSYPEPDSEPAQELPENVKTPFLEAIKGLNDGNWNSCVVMCRRALEEAMSDLGAEGEDLAHQIDNLESQRRITPDLRAWAHEGRLGGKPGAHGAKQKKWASRRDAEEVLEFSRWFFRYVYVLPRQLADKKKEVTPSGDEPTGQELS